MNSDNKFGLPKELIDLVAKVMKEGQVIPFTKKKETTKPPESKKDNKKRFLGALEGKGSLKEEVFSANELKYIEEKVGKGAIDAANAAVRPDKPNAAMIAANAAVRPKPTPKAAVKPNAAMMAAAAAKTPLIPKETPNHLIAAHQAVHKKTSVPVVSAKSKAAEIVARQKANSSGNLRIRGEHDPMHSDDRYNAWKAKQSGVGTKTIAGVTADKFSSMQPKSSSAKPATADPAPKQSGAGTKTVSVRTDRLLTGKKGEGYKEPTRPLPNGTSKPATADPAPKQTTLKLPSSGPVKITGKVAGSSSVKAAPAAKAAAPKPSVSKATSTTKGGTRAAAPLAKEKMASHYESLTKAKDPRNFKALADGIRADSTIRHAEIDHLLRHHYGYDGPNFKTKGQAFDHLDTLHGKTESKHVAVAKTRTVKPPLPKLEGPITAHIDHFKKQLVSHFAKGEHEKFAATLDHLNRHKGMKAGDVKEVASHLSKKSGLRLTQDKPTRVGVLKDIRDHFVAKHGALKEEFMFFSDEMLESFSDYELEHLSIMENK
jgi:hypothetical protein